MLHLEADDLNYYIRRHKFDKKDGNIMKVNNLLPLAKRFYIDKFQ